MDVHSHKDVEKVEDINSLFAYLPAKYSPIVRERLAKRGISVSPEVVRNARNNRECREKIAIMAVLVEVAKENKKAQEDLDHIINH